MPAPASLDEFIDLVRKSALVEERKFSDYLSSSRESGRLPEEPNKLAGRMIRDGLLTNFQAEQLLQGRWKRFMIGRYKVLERLGSGGMGQVFLCEHKMMRRRVAIKVLPSARAEDPSSLERFHREARAVAALDHPNIVRAHDIDQDGNLHFLVMEYVDGSSLQEIGRRFGPMEVPRACQYLLQSAVGLQHAFESGLVHRDIKPGNILVDRAGWVKILDMGLARFFHDEEDIITKRYEESVLGTADYLAPEQAIDSHSVDVRADIYSLGATFYYVLTGRPPFPDGSVTQKLIWHQTKPFQPLRELRPDAPEWLIQIMDRMFAKNPEDRFQTPADVAEAVAPWARQPIDPPPAEWMPNLCLAAAGRDQSMSSATLSRAAHRPTPPAQEDTTRFTGRTRPNVGSGLQPAGQPAATPAAVAVAPEPAQRASGFRPIPAPVPAASKPAAIPSAGADPYQPLWNALTGPPGVGAAPFAPAVEWGTATAGVKRSKLSLALTLALTATVAAAAAFLALALAS